MVVALSVLDTLLAEPVNGLVVAHAHERPLGLLELGVVLRNSSGSGRVLKGKVDDTADDVLQVREEVVEVDEIKLGLDVSVLGKLGVLA